MKVRTYGYIAAALVALAGAFWAGYSTHPERVEYRDRIEYQDRVVEKIVEVRVKDTAVVTHRVVVTVSRPDGTVEKTEVEDTAAVTNEKTATDHARTEDHAGVIEHIKIETAILPDWRVSAKVGVSLGDLSFSALPPLVYGGAVERRIVGPLWGGAWGLSNGTVGISLTFEF